MRTHFRRTVILGAAGLMAALGAATPALAAGATAASPSAAPLDDYLNAVAMTSPSNAWAVGSFQLGGGPVGQTLTEHWNGTSWKLVPSPNPGGTIRSSTLSGVAARSSSAWAVGSYADSAQFQQTLIEHWNGKAWKQVPSPNPGGAGTWNILAGVSYISRTGAWAVGSSGFKALVLRWNGKSWKQVPCPRPGHQSVLTQVAVISPSNAWAVGSYFPNGAPSRNLIEHWNGTSWKRVAAPNRKAAAYQFLQAVSAVSATNIWAVGASNNGTANQTLIEHWNGQSWKLVASPNPAGPGRDNTLHGLSAVSASNLWAVGHYEPGGVRRTLVEHWNGRSWKLAPSPTPGSSALLAGVAATKSIAFAVGAFTSGSASLSLIERHRATWFRIASPNE
jgi:hypothetical protein